MKIKICGVRDLAAAEAIAGNGADFMGFIMSDRFRRYVPPELVREISLKFPSIKKVGVFVDQPAEEVNCLADYCRLDYVQLHGHETAAYAREIAHPIIKAFRYGEDFSLEAAENYPAELILIDSYSKKLVGGSGVSFAWRTAAEEICQLQKPYIIAGGINAENVQEAIEIFQPYGIDASGSMEIAGDKSPRLIAEFIKAARRPS